MNDWSTLTPLLVHIQANLDRDLSLDALGQKARLSPTHLQRVFKGAVGESPKSYVARLRIERAAFCLLVHESTVGEIAAQCGFQHAETFIRAFRRRFGMSPREYRISRRAHRGQQTGRSAALPATRFALSKTRILNLRPMHLAFRRHVGPYEQVPESLFDDLERWAARRRLGKPYIWTGLGHDAPVTTPPDKLRFDAGLLVPGPFEPSGLIGYELLEGGLHAVTTHVGPYTTLGDAYAKVFPRLMTFREYDIVGLPALEVYHSAKVNVQFEMNHTDICLPMRRKHERLR